MLWKSVCCAVQGRGHAKNNIPCQDKVAKLEANGVHVIVLADGAGFIVEKFFYLIAQDDGRNVTQELLNFIF